MGEYHFKLPDLGEGIVEAEIAALHVKLGDTVHEDQPIIDMMTDKATVELPSPVDGKILSICGDAGDQVAVGSVLVTFEVEGEGNKPRTSPEEPVKAEPVPKAPVIETAPAVQEASISSGGKAIASPSVRRKALEQNINLDLVPGSGPAGRISHEDLDAFIACGGRLAVQGKQKQTAVEEIPVIGLRRKIAERMQLSKSSIPHYSYVEEVDVSEVESLRTHMNIHRSVDQPKLTILPFIMMATVKAMAKFPQCNAHYDAENNLVRRFSALHLGIAAQTPNGLMVPVVAHAEVRDIWDMATEMARVSEAARTGKATREELSGSTVTITSLGKIGGIVTTPVINIPEVAIIGVNKIVERPMVLSGAVQIRKMMNLSSSFDHRVVDGFDAAEMIQYIKGLLEHPATLFMGT